MRIKNKFIGYFVVVTIILAAFFYINDHQVKCNIWNGHAMGTAVSIKFCYKEKIDSKRIINEAVAEISRLNNIFSLYKKDSELIKLNKYGFINNPSLELIELLSIAKSYGDISNGLFDVTMQPIWDSTIKEISSGKKINKHLNLVDYREIKISPKKIFFNKTHMAVSLNAIAQGYITDKITEFLIRQGIKNALIDIGEIRAIGKNKNGKLWTAGIRDPRKKNKNEYMKKVNLFNRSLSTSGGYGTPLNKDKTKHHIFNPKTGESVNKYMSVSVIADNATKADALSTAFYIMSVNKIESLLKKLPKVGVYILYPNGKTLTLGNFHK